MRRSLGLVLVAVVPVLAAEPVKIDFETHETARLAPGFTAAMTGKGAKSEWLVEEDPRAASGQRVLSQTSTDAEAHRYPLCIHEATTARDVTVKVRFKAVAGKVDRAGGIAVRVVDANNYYVARANALEDNVRFYRVADGQRGKPIASANVKVSANEWHSLAITARGSTFEVSFDGKSLFTAEDAGADAKGKVALWTKADSVTRFDDLEIIPLDEAR